MQNLFELIGQTLSITAPVFTMILVGWAFYKINLINDNFINVASQLVFKVTLPLLIFINIVNSNLTGLINYKMLIYTFLVTLLAFIILIWQARFVHNNSDKASFVQGSFRGNTGIMAMALIANQFGDIGIAKASILLALVVVMYNILAVIALSMWRDGKKLSAGKLLRDVLSNPLIIAVFLALFSYKLSIKYPTWLLDTGNYFASMTLPLALLCIGGSIKLYTLLHLDLATFFASLNKLIIFPIIMTYGAYWFGFCGMDLAIMFIFFAAPTATVSFVMAQAMNANANMAANIIAITTLLSIFTISLGIFLLKLFNI